MRGEFRAFPNTGKGNPHPGVRREPGTPYGEPKPPLPKGEQAVVSASKNRLGWVDRWLSYSLSFAGLMACWGGGRRYCLHQPIPHIRACRCSFHCLPSRRCTRAQPSSIFLRLGCRYVKTDELKCESSEYLAEMSWGHG